MRSIVWTTYVLALKLEELKNLVVEHNELEMARGAKQGQHTRSHRVALNKGEASLDLLLAE